MRLGYRPDPFGRRNRLRAKEFPRKPQQCSNFVELLLEQRLTHSRHANGEAADPQFTRSEPQY